MYELSLSVLNVQIAEAFEPLFRPKRLKVFFGGRGAAKSWGFAQALEIKAYQQPLRILCTREFQGSIQESVHKLLGDTAERIGLGSFYSVQQNVIRGINGSNFIFEGLKNNTTKIKSMEGIDIVWCEEAEAISERSWDLLIPTIRKAGSEIWVSFNPADEQDATYQRFVAPYLQEIEANGFYEDDQIYVAKVGWQDNPWFPEELRKEMEDCKRTNYRKYLHIWEGECNADYTDSIIQPEWVEAAVDAHKRLGFKAEGVKSLGFDPADEGSDAKAYAYRHGVVVKQAYQWKEGDIADAIDKAFDVADELRCTDLVYDAIGVGAGVKVKLKRKDYRERMVVTGFVGSETPSSPDSKYMGDRPNKEVFRNRRAQWWWYLRDRFEKTYRAVEKGEYIDPDELISLDSECEHLSALKSELVRVQRKRGPANTLIQIESKQDMKKREMPSPNLADALVMAFANPPPNPGFLAPLQLDTRGIV